MAKIEQTKKKIITLTFRQEPGDPDYGSCTWAEFIFDLDAYSLSILSDCGNYSYKWTPTPKSESFLHLMGRVDAGYLLDKISDRNVINEDKTYDNLCALLKEYGASLNELDADGLPVYDEEALRSACCQDNSDLTLHAITDVLKGTPAETADSYEVWNCIETDFSLNAKKIAAVFQEYAAPMCAQLDTQAGPPVKKNIVITIDGPAAAGKTTAAKTLAARLPGFRYIDTGAFYRLIAYYREHDSAGAWSSWLNRAAESVKVLPGENGAQDMMARINGVWVKILPDSELRTPAITEQASILSTSPDVRTLVNRLIRQYADGVNAVMEGRDTGSAVMPRADFKFYLDAAPGVRAARRYKDLQTAGVKTSLDEVRADIARRDGRDASREHDPLKAPEGAIKIDSSNMTAEQVATFIQGIVERSIPLILENS